MNQLVPKRKVEHAALSCGTDNDKVAVVRHDWPRFGWMPGSACEKGGKALIASSQLGDDSGRRWLLFEHRIRSD